MKKQRKGLVFIKDKRKLQKFNEKYINPENVKMAILFLPLLILLLRQCQKGDFKLDDFYDVSILVSFLIVFVCEAIANMVSNAITRRTEDAMKLNDNYARLVGKYCLDKDHMVQYVGTDEKRVYIPAIVMGSRRIIDDPPFELEITPKLVDGKVERYSLPQQVAENSEDLFKAHHSSAVYNNVNIRVCDLCFEGNRVNMYYGYTTYFDSLLTNRAMDFPFRKNRTIREIYEPGPIISQLSDSKLSNHLGFNGFVELRDGKVIFVHRSQKVSIGKGTWSQSIGASLKTMYCLDKDRALTTQGISNAIRMEIWDELKIKVSEQEDLSKTIFAFYRDLVEGGKPQFLFYYKTDLYNSTEFEQHFRDCLKGKQTQKENKKKQIVDGQEFVFYTVEELRRFSFTEKEMVVSRDLQYPMMPSSVASVVLMLKMR